MTGIALPRARTRRRRRRPFGPFEKGVLFIIVCGAMQIVICVVALAGRDLPEGNVPMVIAETLGVTVGAWAIKLYWPFLREWWDGDV